MPSTNVRTGRAGEYTAAGIITTLADVDVNIVTQPHYDLLVHFGSRDVKVQVKAAGNVQTKTKTNGYRHFNFKTARGVKPCVPLDPAMFDIICFVCLPARLCLFKVSKDVTTTTTKIKEGLFTPEAERESWASVVDQLSLT